MASHCDVVIGYHRNDLEFAEKLADKLKKSGLTVWYSKPSGNDMEPSEAILGCKVYLPLMTEDSAVDKTIQEQLSLAYISNSAIYPLSKIRYRYLSPKLNGGAKLMLAKINWCFVFDMDEFESKTDVLISCMKKDIKNMSAQSASDTLGDAGFSLDQAMAHGLELGGDGSGFEGVDRGISLSDISSDTPFWDRHFKGKHEVPWKDFIQKFQSDYGKKIDEAFPDLQEDKKHFLSNLVFKEVFNLKNMISREAYKKFCKTDGPHAFYTEVQEYAVAYLSLREVISMDSSLRISTIQNLGAFSFPAIVCGLTDMLQDEDPNIRAVAAIALAHAGKENPDTSEKLVGLIEDEDRLVRESACLSLGFLKATDKVNYIVDRWRNDPISHVREAAELALSKLEVPEAKKCMKVTQVLSSEMKALKPVVETAPVVQPLPASVNQTTKL